MAANTPASFQKLVIYEVFVRNHSQEGTFAGVTTDLSRIKALGADAVWFMPIHPIGEAKRKGSAGSPYAIADYRAINPKYGTEADFKQLIDTAHGLGLKVMIDVVYNHTSPDSVLARQHPDWFYQDETGQPIPRFPEWSDVVDLWYRHPELAAYQIETLLKWVKLGVDGYRCDVASLVPLEFWLQARAAVAEIKPDFIWLAESVHPHFVRLMRRLGYPALSDSEVYQAFDLTYDYDIHDDWVACLRGNSSLADYARMIAWQEVIYPVNYIKLRFVENHDQPRAAALIPGIDQLKCWTAFMAFNKGAFLIYAGQEAGATKLPSLFEVELIEWPEGQPVLSSFLARLAALKKDPATDGSFEIVAAETHFQARWSGDEGGLYGIFNVQGQTGAVSVELPDGVYLNLLDDTQIIVSAGQIQLPLLPVIVRFKQK
ncbi:MAG: alpha-amylase [Anaerolineae bacterium]|nr:alpha-amylase [Anaerolineae bacterium]